MPRKGSRKFNLRKVRASPTITVGGLASATAVEEDFFGTNDEGYKVVSVEAAWSMENHTSNEGPVLVGFAHGDYTVTEIKECLESASINQGNLIQRERANRLVRVVGMFAGNSQDEVLNDGQPIKTKLNWYIPEGKTFLVWAYNDSSGTFTTGTLIHVNGHGWIRN